MREALVDLLAALGTPDADPFTTPFRADGRGLDKLLDLVAFDIVPETRTITIVNKGDPAKSVSVGLTDAPTRFTLPENVVGIDTSGIASLVGRFNQIGAIQSGRNFDPIIANGFLDFGANKQLLLDDLNNSSDTLSISRWAIDGCRRIVSGAAVCDVIGTLYSDNIPVDFLLMPVIKDGSEWKFFGNQLDTIFYFRPTFSIVRRADLQQKLNGFSLSVDRVQAQGAASSVSLAFSTDRGNTFGNPVVNLLVPGGCGTDFLITPSRCSNFAEIGALTIASLNQAVSDGRLVGKVTVVINGQPAENIFRVLVPFFTESTGLTAHDLKAEFNEARTSVSFNTAT